MLLVNPAAGLGTEPDGIVVLDESFARGLVRTAEGSANTTGNTILEGPPDLVIEVVSPSSANKDKVQHLRE
jgi:Uma2 family endonuclease